MPVQTDTLVTQVGPGNPSGKVLGQSPTDPIAFYGATPIPQPSGPAEAANTVVGDGAVTEYTSTQSPTGTATITAGEQSVTVTGVLATDLVIINKPTTDAGLALCSGRVSAANTVKLTFANPTAGTLTPTVTQGYLVTTVPAAMQLSAVLTPAVVAAKTIAEQTFSGITGLAVGMVVQVNKPTQQTGLAVLSARVVSSNTLGITYANPTAAAITPTAAETYIIAALNGLSAASQIMEFGVNIGTAAASGIATITTAEIAVTVAGILATDIVVGMSKPTTQTLMSGTGRVSAANTVQIPFVNPTAATVTPTASEIYATTIFRANPSAVMSLFTASIAPGSVAANTTAEQTFAVPGIVSGQPILANPQLDLAAANLGVGIGGVRASATNTLAVCFINVTGAAIVPPTGNWIIGHFNQPIPTAGNYIQQRTVISTTAAEVNAQRSALVSLGLIAGA